MNDVDFNLIGRKFLHRRGQRFLRPLHIRLDDQRQGFGALAHRFKDVLQFCCLLLGQSYIAELALTEERNFACFALIAQYHHFIAGLRNLGHAENLHGDGWSCQIHRSTIFIKHRADATKCSSRKDDISLAQRTGLHEDRGDRPTTLVNTRLNNQALGQRIDRRLKFEHFRLQQDILQQFINTLAGLGRYRDERRLTTVLFGYDLFSHQFRFHPIGIGLWLVDLVDGHHDGHLCGLRMSDGLAGLGHDAIIGCHHKNHDIRGIGTTRTHGGKCLVTRGVQESDHTPFRGHMIGTDMLGDTTGLSRSHLGAANIVEQRCLAVIDVSHDGDHRRTGNRRGLGQGLGIRVLEESLGVVEFCGDSLVSHLLNDNHGRLLIQHLIDGHHLTHLHEHLDHLSPLDRHLVGKICHGDGFGYVHLTGLRFGRGHERVAILSGTVTRPALGC